MLWHCYCMVAYCRCVILPQYHSFPLLANKPVRPRPFIHCLDPYIRLTRGSNRNLIHKSYVVHSLGVLYGSLLRSQERFSSKRRRPSKRVLGPMKTRNLKAKHSTIFHPLEGDHSLNSKLQALIKWQCGFPFPPGQ